MMMALLLASALMAPSLPNISFCCDKNNDLYRALSASVGKLPRSESPSVAISNAPVGSALMVLADGYPERLTPMTLADYEAARQKNLRIYVEFPATIPGKVVGKPKGIQWERAVVRTDFFGAALPSMRILEIHGCRYLPVETENPFMVMARVAGNDTAVVGLPKEIHPILFEEQSVLFASTKLSHFVTARYGPVADWNIVWEGVFRWLLPGQTPPKLKWTPSVRPTCSRASKLAGDAELNAVKRGADWFIRSRLLFDQASVEAYDRQTTDARMQSPGLTPDVKAGDGSYGIRECFLSKINVDGSQWVSNARRGDCHAESAMALAMGAQVLGDERKAKIAGNLLDFYLFKSDARKKQYGDPTHPAYGTIAWGIDSYAWYKAVYGDDNARVLLGAISAGSLLGESRWDEAILKCLLGNLRTTGKQGFRGWRIDLEDYGKDWRPFYDRELIHYSPHYESYLWSCFLWAYHKTGDRIFLDRTANAIKMTMAAYPDQWAWTNSFQMERCRMLLPLAWLVRVQDTPEHRGWLKRVAVDLLKNQDACGAIRDEIGDPSKGESLVPATNEGYGTSETAILQKNGEPMVDMLYSMNFAILGLHEAAAVTGEKLYIDAENKLAGFLCRVQVRSKSHPELDGTWFRGFDYGRWDYWGSNADAGWGIWSTETGWSASWIVTCLGLRQMKTSLWDLMSKSKLDRLMPALKAEMMPGGEVNLRDAVHGTRRESFACH